MGRHDLARDAARTRAGGAELVPLRSSPKRVHRLALTGRLGQDSAVALEAAIDELCEAGIDVLILDLSRLTEIDPTGVRVIALRCMLCGRRGVAIEMIPGRATVQAAFEVAGCLEQLPFRSSPSIEAPPREWRETPAAPKNSGRTA
jgi:anti-anti-sigma factor